MPSEKAAAKACRLDVAPYEVQLAVQHLECELDMPERVLFFPHYHFVTWSSVKRVGVIEIWAVAAVLWTTVFPR